MEYGVRTWDYIYTDPLNKSSPSGDSFGQWTLQPLRKETKEGLPGAVGTVLSRFWARMDAP